MKNLYKTYFNQKMKELKLSHHQFVVSKKDVKKDDFMMHFQKLNIS
jgi:hypothetical protein